MEFRDEDDDVESLLPFGAEHFMRRALEQAQQAASEDEVPVGAIISACAVGSARFSRWL